MPQSAEDQTPEKVSEHVKDGKPFEGLFLLLELIEAVEVWSANQSQELGNNKNVEKRKDKVLNAKKDAENHEVLFQPGEELSVLREIN